ncbi:MAG: tRNA (adenosine(37)-N6)-threonylcarbamoyltransferase complex dimerization subunit type 1 TsaB, partial [Kiritimatiellales bacterium]
MKDESGIVLGIELSSRQGSVALLKDGVLLAEKTWVGERVRHNTIFQTLETLLQETHISYYDISLYAVGRGPGSFSGMRMSFAIAQALALPNKTEVRAVSSGAALALAVARDGAKQIAVVGDARRGQFWFGM